MYRQAIVESGARIFLRKNRLCIETDDLHQLPVEDLAALVLDSREIEVTAYALERLAANGTVVIFCNEKHMPSGVLLPYGSHSRRLRTVRKQISQSKPRLKQLWKQVVRQKIKNQGRCLELCGKENVVKPWIPQVRSGDTTNVEGTAAALYFKALYGGGFIRHTSDTVNDILNYGYAVIRASIARYLAIYGFEPSLGLFHHSELNAFNLADDLIEPYRPLVDLYAFRHRESEEEMLTKEMRRGLVQLLNADILSDGEVHGVNYAIERTVQSLSRCYEEESEMLLLPELLPLRIHSYE